MFYFCARSFFNLFFLEITAAIFFYIYSVFPTFYAPTIKAKLLPLTFPSMGLELKNRQKNLFNSGYSILLKTIFDGKGTGLSNNNYA